MTLPAGIYSSDDLPENYWEPCDICGEQPNGYMMHISQCGCGSPGNHPVHLSCFAVDLATRFVQDGANEAQSVPCRSCGQLIFDADERGEVFARATYAADCGRLGNFSGVSDVLVRIVRFRNVGDPSAFGRQ